MTYSDSHVSFAFRSPLSDELNVPQPGPSKAETLKCTNCGSLAPGRQWANSILAPADAGKCLAGHASLVYKVYERSTIAKHSSRHSVPNLCRRCDNLHPLRIIRAEVERKKTFGLLRGEPRRR
jgi:hypothetical protein